MNQDDLSEAAEISIDRLRHIEMEDSVGIFISTSRKLAAALGMTVAAFRLEMAPREEAPEAMSRGRKRSPGRSGNIKAKSAACNAPADRPGK